MRRLIIGDLHGQLKALKQVFALSNFDYDNDKLICLGDIADGGYEVYECVEELMKIKNFVLVLGNHDVWFMDHIASGWAEKIWLHQGGINTLDSYKTKYMADDFGEVNIPVTHQDFFNNGKYYHIEDNMLFVHGGMNPTIPIEQNTKQVLTWDRDLIKVAMNQRIEPYDKFVGHTTTQLINKGSTVPIKYNNLYMLDTGAGWNGKLTIMDIDTQQYWQSDKQIPRR